MSRKADDYVDLDQEDYRASDGTRVTEQVADDAVARALQRSRSKRAGRPSLSAPGAKSPTVNARVPADVKTRLQQLAKDRGVRESDLVREAVETLVGRP